MQKDKKTMIYFSDRYRKKTVMRIITFSVAVILLITALLIAHHYAPFQLEVVVVYLGIGALIAGLLSMIKPFRFIHINSSRSGLLVATAGLLVFMVGMIWPSSTIRSSRTHQRIDDFMPEYQFYEYHEASVNAPAEAVSSAIKNVSFADIPMAMCLMRIRAMASGQFTETDLPGAKPVRELLSKPILDVLSQPGTGFLTLDNSNPYEYVGGMVGKPWSNDLPGNVTTPDEFRAFRLSGNIKVAFNMHIFDMGNGKSRLTTETRIIGVDESARKTFARYWRIIYPGSAIIRRVWLDAIVAHAIQ
jgi:hypothetical protein